MTPPDQMAALRALAERATPGPWEAEGDYKSPDILACGSVVAVTIASDMKPPVDKANAEFIAAANPSAVLALLDENARMREALAGVLPYMEAAEAAGLTGGEGCHWPVELVRAALEPRA